MGFSTVHNRRTLSANVENAILQYSRLEKDPTRWAQGQVMSTVYALAGHIAYGISGKSTMVEKNLKLANGILEEAQTINNNNSNEVDYAVAPWHQARGASNLQIGNNYIYPLGQTFNIPQVNNPTTASSGSFPDASN